MLVMMMRRRTTPNPINIETMVGITFLAFGQREASHTACGERRSWL
jgi:hypothetical protein